MRRAGDAANLASLCVDVRRHRQQRTGERPECSRGWRFGRAASRLSTRSARVCDCAMRIRRMSELFVSGTRLATTLTWRMLGGSVGAGLLAPTARSLPSLRMVEVTSDRLLRMMMARLALA